MSLKKGFLYVLVANILVLLGSLFNGFMLPKILSIDTYANIKLYQLYISYAGILHLGFADGIYIRHGGKKVKDIDKKDVLSEYKTFKIFQFFIVIPLILFSIFIKNEILFFVSISIFPINASTYLCNLFNAVGEFKKYSKYTSINSLLTFMLNFLLLLIIKCDNSNIYILVYALLYFLYYVFLELQNHVLFGKDNSVFDIKYIILNIKNGISLTLGGFCNVLFVGIDRLFVRHLINIVTFALYSFAASVQNLMNVFVSSISIVTYNYFCRENSTFEVKRFKSLILICSAALLSMFFPAEFIVINFIPQYIDSINILIILFVCQLFSIIIRCFYVNLYKARKKQFKYLITMVFMITFAVALNFAFFKIYGSAIAIAIATLITYVIWYIIGELDFKEYHFNIKEYAFLIISALVFIFCSLHLEPILGFIIYILAIILASFIFTNNAFNYLYSFVRKHFLKYTKGRYFHEKN